MRQPKMSSPGQLGLGSTGSGSNLLSVPVASSKAGKVALQAERERAEAAMRDRRAPTRSSCYQVASLNETAGKKLCRKQPARMVRYSRAHLVRVYPAGMRIDSSNFNPLQFWTFGAQMVALNFQTPDVAMALNSALFEQNGSCGYILKPRVLWDPEAPMYQQFNPWNVKEWTSQAVPNGIPPVHLNLQIISGQSVGGGGGQVGGSPLVEVELLGIPADCIKDKTKPVLRNTINPIWNASFHFRVAFLELAFLRVAVVDTAAGGGNGKCVAQRVLPLRALRPGYRHLRLRAPNNTPLDHSTLFIHSRLEEEEYIEVEDDTALASPPKANPASLAVLKRQVFVLRIHGLVADGGVTVYAQASSTVREVIASALAGAGRSNDSTEDYLLVEERVEESSAAVAVAAEKARRAMRRRRVDLAGRTRS